MIPLTLSNRRLQSAARIVDGTSGKWAAIRILRLLVLLMLMLIMLGCDGPDEIYSDRELASDPLPEFDDRAFTGMWLEEGKPVYFTQKDHGHYIFHLPDDAENPDLPVKIKRAGDVLVMEFERNLGGSILYWPCVADVTDNRLQLSCLAADAKSVPALQLQPRKFDDSVTFVATNDGEHLRNFISANAHDERYFHPALLLTRPQPRTIARLRHAAERGDAAAAERLGRAYDDGEIVASDSAEAIRWATVAAESGRPSAQVLLGRLLRSYASVTDRESAAEEALVWFRRAADQDYGPAFFEIGNIYMYGALRDPDIAMDWYRRGADIGDFPCTAELGIAYWDGEYLPRDEAKAVALLDAVHGSLNDARIWQALADARLHALDPELRNPAEALDSAEHLLKLSRNSSVLVLAAEAAFASQQYDRAAIYQEQAVEMTSGQNAEYVAVLADYRSYLPDRVPSEQAVTSP